MIINQIIITIFYTVEKRIYQTDYNIQINRICLD